MKKAPIHGLTVNQPWAFWIVRPDLPAPERHRAYRGGLMKGVVEADSPEARHLAGHYLAIHAGKAFEYVPIRWLRERGIKVEHPPRERVFKDAVIGVAYVAAFVTNPAVELPRRQRSWFTGNGLHLENIVPIPPLAYRSEDGALWELSADLLEQIRERFRFAMSD
jgi:hypothetical protein